MSERARHRWILVLAALALRGPWLLLSPGAPFDMESYARVAGLGPAGLYSAAETAGRYPYLPLWWALLQVLGGLQSFFGGDFSLWARLPGVAGDAAVACLIYSLVERRSRGTAALAAGPGLASSGKAGLLAGLGWALNPLAALISVGHGQFDSLALALLLASAWWLEYDADPRAELWSALSFGLAVALKSWPLAFLPLYLGVFVSRREALRYAAWSLGLPLLLLLPWLYWDGLEAVLGRLGYSGATALGLSGALRACFFAVDAPVALYRQVDDAWRLLSAGALGLLFCLGLWRVRRLRLLDGLAWAAAGLVLFAPGLSPQYLAWPAAFSLLLAPGLAWRWNLASLLLLLLFYAGFMPPVLAGAAAWAPPALPALVILAWAALNLVWWAGGLYDWLRLGPPLWGGSKRSSFLR